MTASPAKLLITGFGPYPGVPANPTAELVPRLHQALERKLPTTPLRSEILPVDWQRAPQRLAQLLDATVPDVALHFGTSTKAAAILVETVARNRRKMAVDQTGAGPAGRVVAAGGARLVRACRALHPLVGRLRSRGHPVERSNDAGRYLCNSIYYSSLCHAAAAPRPRLTLFVHIPPGLTGLGDASDIVPERGASLPLSTLLPAATELTLELLALHDAQLARPLRSTEREENEAWTTSDAAC
jgi:pyroglutamyl-peptidase